MACFFNWQSGVKQFQVGQWAILIDVRNHTHLKYCANLLKERSSDLMNLCTVAQMVNLLQHSHRRWIDLMLGGTERLRLIYWWTVKTERVERGHCFWHLLYTQGCSDETIQIHPSPPEARVLTHTWMQRGESPYTELTKESFLVMAKACVTVCDITLSHYSAHIW